MPHDIGTHVLVVDDEPGFRELLTRILEASGCEVRTAEDAHAALRSIEADPPAVAVCDVHMPGPDGIWLARRIRETSPSTAVVLATSDDTIPPADTFRKGIVAYIVKPFDRRAVVGAVTDALRWAERESGQEMPVPVMPLPSPAPPPAARARGPWLRPAAAIALVVLTGGGAFYAFTHRAHGQDALAAVQAATGVVQTTDAKGQMLGQGSGFFVAPDLVVTNRHVVRGAVSATMRQASADGVFAIAGVVAEDPEHDLALLQTSRPGASFLDVHPVKMPSLGDEIAVYGAPLGLEGTLSKGIVSAQPQDDEQMLQISAPISPGSSGSAVINRAGEVIGVATATRFEGQNLNFAVSAKHVSALIASRGSVRPLITLARGAGNDAERHELLGNVWKVAITTQTFAPATTRQATIIFDRQGNVLERSGPDAATPGIEPSAARGVADEYDAMGNLVHRRDADGTQWRFEYWFDQRANWTVREAIRLNPDGSRTLVSRETRAIDYWP